MTAPLNTGSCRAGNVATGESTVVPRRSKSRCNLKLNVGGDGVHRTTAPTFNREVVQAGLESVAGVTKHKAQVARYRRRFANEYAGVYASEIMRAVIADTGKELIAEFAIKPEIRADATTELPPDVPAAPIALLRDEQDHYIVTGGELQGQRGHFGRNAAGQVVTVDMAGRVFTRE